MSGLNISKCLDPLSGAGKVKDQSDISVRLVPIPLSRPGACRPGSIWRPIPPPILNPPSLRMCNILFSFILKQQHFPLIASNP